MLEARFVETATPEALRAGLAREMRGYVRFPSSLDRPTSVNHSLSRKDQRKWPRLRLAIPIFVRTSGGDGKDFLEFATAINISPGGALVVARRSVAKSASVSLEIPSAPTPAVHGMPRSSHSMRAKAVWVRHFDDYHLLGLKFARPLGTDVRKATRMSLRKVRSAV